jgi:DUF4097 and DUF4098 domain-containing protein YvlB
MKKVALGALLVLIIGIIGLFTVSGGAFSFGNNVEINERETIPSKNIKEMKVNVDVGEIRIRESKNDDITIHFHGNVPKKVKEQLTFNVEEQSTSVEVVVSQSNKFFMQIPFINSDISSERTLDVSLPKNLLDKFEVKADVGDIHIDQINSSGLTAHSDVGDIYVNQFKGIGTFVSSVGDIELEKISGKINAKTDTGEIDINLEEMKDDIELSSDVGDITITFVKEPENIVFDLSSDVGDVSINGFKGFENRTTGSIITQLGSGGPLLEVKTDIGEITVGK